MSSNRHDQYRTGLKKLGKVLGYDSTSPRHSSATDCRWRGIFGNHREVITLEAKIEDVPSGKITASDIGQVHNQITRAKSEYESMGYIVRGAVVSHLSELMPDAESSAGVIRIISKDTVLELWNRAKELLSQYRNLWSLDDINIRRKAVEAIRPKIPSNGWLIKALDIDERFISSEQLLNEWGQ